MNKHTVFRSQLLNAAKKEKEKWEPERVAPISPTPQDLIDRYMLMLYCSSERMRELVFIDQGIGRFWNVSYIDFYWFGTLFLNLSTYGFTCFCAKGCGDGRWLVSAAKMYRCICWGVDIDTNRVSVSLPAPTEVSLKFESYWQFHTYYLFLSFHLLEATSTYWDFKFRLLLYKSSNVFTCNHILGTKCEHHPKTKAICRMFYWNDCSISGGE